MKGKYCLGKLNELKNLSDLKGLFLVIINADKIPPHIGLIYNQQYFSLTTTGVSLGEPAEVLYRLINIKSSCTVFIKLNEAASNFNLKEELKEYFEEYDMAIDNVTCLQPIKDFFGECFYLGVGNVRFVFELIPLLKNNGLIESQSGIHVKEHFVDGKFFLNTYEMSDVFDRINDLKKNA